MRRIKRIDSSTERYRYYYDGDQEIYETIGTQGVSGSDRLNQRTIRLPGSVDEPVVMISYDQNGAETGRTWAHQNRLGSVVATTNDSGAVTGEYRYSPYGVSGTEGDDGFPFRFTGQRLDPETGLYYYKARYYDPEIGRFLQTDPVGYDDQMNMYAYCANDPLGCTDPTGRSIYTKAFKFVLKGGDAGATFAGQIQDGATLISPSATPFQRAEAFVNLVSELAPVSTRDVGEVTTGASNVIKKIKISRSKSPESARHLEESGATGRQLTVDRAGRDQRRKDNMKGVQTKAGQDRDESPPAVFKESENGSVRHIDSSDNRSSGGQLGNQLKDVPDGGCIEIEICN